MNVGNHDKAGKKSSIYFKKSAIRVPIDLDLLLASAFASLRYVAIVTPSGVVGLGVEITRRTDVLHEVKIALVARFPVAGSAVKQEQAHLLTRPMEVDHVTAAHLESLCFDI